MASKPAGEPEEPPEEPPGFKALKLRRQLSRELPPDLSDFLNTHGNVADSFKVQFDSSEARMREIVADFMKSFEDMEKIQSRAAHGVAAAALAAGLAGAAAVVGLAADHAGSGEPGLAVVGLAGDGLAGSGEPVLAAVQADHAAGSAEAAFAALGLAGAALVGAIRAKMNCKEAAAQKVEELLNEFLSLVQPLTDELEEVRRTRQMLENKSSDVQAEETLTDEKDQDLRKLRDQSEEALNEVLSLLKVTDEMKMLLNIFRVHQTPETYQKFSESIRRSADQSLKVMEIRFRL